MGYLRRIPYKVVKQLPFSVKLVLNRIINRGFLVGLVGVVLNGDEEILILEHTYRKGFPSGLPTGWLKAGEPITEALKREIREETGYEVVFEEILAVRSRERPRRIDVWMKYRYAGGAFRPSSEVSAASFFGFEELPDVLPEQWDFLNRNRDRIQRPTGPGPNFRTSVSAVIFNDQDQVLLIKENYGRRRYGPPGGAVERGEDPLTALEREVLEEVGVEIRPQHVIGTYVVEQPHPDSPSMHLAFRCVMEGVPSPQNPEEIAEIGWFHPEDLPKPLTSLGPFIIRDAAAAERGTIRRFIRHPDGSLQDPLG